MFSAAEPTLVRTMPYKRDYHHEDQKSGLIIAVVMVAIFMVVTLTGTIFFYRCKQQRQRSGTDGPVSDGPFWDVEAQREEASFPRLRSAALQRGHAVPLERMGTDWTSGFHEATGWKQLNRDIDEHDTGRKATRSHSNPYSGANARQNPERKLLSQSAQINRKVHDTVKLHKPLPELPSR